MSPPTSLSDSDAPTTFLLTPGTDTITIKADNGAGSVVFLTTTITVLHHSVTFTPTFFIYGF